MATELESLVVKVEVDTSALQSAYAEIERFEKKVQAVSKRMATASSAAVSRVTVASGPSSTSTLDQFSMAATGAGLALSLLLPQSLLYRIGAAIAGAIIGALAPKVAELIDGVETPEERIANLQRRIETQEFVLAQQEALHEAEPTKTASVLHNIEQAKENLANLNDQLAEAEATLDALQNQAAPGIGAMAELAAAVEALTGRLDPELVLAMQNVNEMWLLLRDMALDSLEPVEQEIDRLAEKLRRLRNAASDGGGEPMPGVSEPLVGVFHSGGGDDALGGGIGSDTLGDDGSSSGITGLTADLEPFNTLLVAARGESEELGRVLHEALGGVPEELGEIVEALGGAVLDALENGTDVLEALEQAGRQAADGLLHSLLQSEEVRAELGELAGVIEGVLTDALNGNIDSWEDLGRVALEVLDAIIAKLLETQEAGSGGDGGGILGLVGSLIGSVASAYLGGGSTVGGSFGIGDTTGAGGAGFSYTGYGGPRAGGGSVVPSRAFLVGEQGPELFVPNLPGSIIPNDLLGSEGGGMALNVTINAPGADREGLEGVRAELRGLRAALQQVNGSIEPRAAAEIARLADRGGGFARTVGRRAN